MCKFRKAIVVLLSALVCLGGSVRYYDYAVPIPHPTKGASVGVNSALVSSPLTSRGSRAVQFLVNDKRSKGKYHFGYDTGGGDMGSYREEVREPNGTIKGFYGYVDPEGTLRITEYVADSAGFRSSEKKIELRNNNSPDPEDLEVMERLQLIGPIPKPLAELFKKSSRT